MLVFKLSANVLCVLKIHYTSYLFLNIVVSYQSLHFVNTVLIYEIQNNDGNAYVLWCE